jgi:hypothetical protein
MNVAEHNRLYAEALVRARERYYREVSEGVRADHRMLLEKAKKREQCPNYPISSNVQ